MELSAQTLREVTFGQKVRGYDPEDVDDFLDQVAEGIDGLVEQLRQANERADSAERAASEVASSAPVTSAPTPEPVVAPAPAPSSSVGAIWARAEAAAESALEEAREEAGRILEDARSTTERQLTEARETSESQLLAARTESETTRNAARAESEALLSNARAEAESTLNNARNDAENAISSARAEAARLADEAQGQLRIDIDRLEHARSDLQTSVDALSGYLDNELGKARNTLHEALGALDRYSSGEEAPRSNSVDVPAAAPVASAPVAAYDEPAPYSEPVVDPAPWEAEAQAPVEPAPWETDASQNNDLIEEDLPWATSVEAEQQADHAAVEQPVEAPRENEEDVDPFLAELRRAVHDDSPLGPREDTDDNSIDSLYSDDDDDNRGGGLFRRKK